MTISWSLLPATPNLEQYGISHQKNPCWPIDQDRSQLAELGYGVFNEDFEGSVWDVARTEISDPNTVASLTSQGITWISNHPETNNITTSSGAARSGNWGGYDAEHGVATGVPGDCDVDNPPTSCLYHDGLSGKTQPGGAVLHGVGAYIHGTCGAKMVAILDGGTPISLGLAGFFEEQFHGVIDAGSGGFSEFEFREVDGKVGQSLFVWFDDFRIAAAGAPTNIAPVADAGSDQSVSVSEVVVLDGSASYDANGDPITYSWSLTDKPAASVATLSNPASVNPTFVADISGYYTAELVVGDAVGNSLPDSVEINAAATQSCQFFIIRSKVGKGAVVCL